MPAFRAQNPAAFTGNVVALNARQHRQPLTHRLAHHATLFCSDRRSDADVFWLKENAEFLNILDVTGSAEAASDACAVYEETYERIDDRLGAHPQYYRFLLSIALDLEDLGLPGDKAARMCDWAGRMGLPAAELSDLQRAEALRLLARRGVGRPDPALAMRLHQFINRAETFAIPNRKAAYELTHIVFYLSEYGQRDPGLSSDARRSLMFAGLLAYLDQDFDILSEICISMRYAGMQPSSIWEGAVMMALRSVTPSAIGSEFGQSSQHDDYHAYFVSAWLAGLAGLQTMPALLPSGPVRFDMPEPSARPLQRMSAVLKTLISDEWEVARPLIRSELDEAGLRVLDAAETSTGVFDTFFRLFARRLRP